MSISNNELDSIFGLAKQEQPVTSFSEATELFLAASAAGVGAGLATKSAIKGFSLNSWLVVAGIGSLALAGVVEL